MKHYAEIFYVIDLVFEPKDTKMLGKSCSKNKKLIPIKTEIIITYKVKTRSLETALEEIKIRMKDTKLLKYIEWRGGMRKKI